MAMTNRHSGTPEYDAVWPEASAPAATNAPWTPYMVPLTRSSTHPSVEENIVAAASNAAATTKIQPHTIIGSPGAHSSDAFAPAKIGELNRVDCDQAEMTPSARVTRMHV